MDNDQVSERSGEARYILSSTIFNEAFMRVREGYIQRMEDGDALNERQRDVLQLGLQNLKAVRRVLESCIEDAAVKQILPEEF